MSDATRLTAIVNEIRQAHITRQELQVGYLGPRKYREAQRIENTLTRLHMELSQCLDAQVPERPRAR